MVRVKEKTEVTRKEVQEMLKVSQTMSGRILKKLADQKLFTSVGKGKSTKYVLLKK